MARSDDDLRPVMSGRKPASGPNLKIKAFIEKTHGKPGRGGAGKCVALPGPSARTAIVVSSRHVSGADAYARYIDRDGAETFTAEMEKVSAKEVVKDWANDELHHRRILPIPYGVDDHVAYVRGFAKKLEEAYGTEIKWVASAHRDTESFHVHMMIQGRDELGRKFDMTNDFMRNGEWRLATQVATELGGPLTPKEIVAEQERQQRKLDLGISHPELGSNGGWALNINVERDNKNEITRGVMGIMTDHGAAYRINFDPKKPHALIAYVGSYDRAERIAKEIQERFGEQLKPIENRYIEASSLMLTDSVSASFQAKGDREFGKLTAKGLPILREHEKAIGDKPIEQKMALALNHRDKADEVLMERYGAFYGGKERAEALERLPELHRTHKREMGLEL